MSGLFEAALVAALLAGLAGGAHCAAMCGGIVGAVCGPRSKNGPFASWWLRTLAYNAGRIATYMVAGALAGGLGAAGLALRGGPAVQQALLVMMSAALLLLAIYLAGYPPLVRGLEAGGRALWRHIGPWSRSFLPADTPARAFGLGLVWGWLPCGMVYAALIVALATAGPAHGALLMLAFGLGTLPNLLVISAWFGSLGGLASARVPRLACAAVIAAAGLYGVLLAVMPHAHAA
jgi:uncharacterized protein